MPRIPPRLLRQARATDVLLARLLPVCRDLSSAQRELRWIREHARTVSKAPPLSNANHLVRHYVCRRSRGEPLQYILGSEFFGDLEINCRPGVLIPRQETAVAVSNLVRLLSRNLESLPSHLRVLDLCTGSGCIPLLFYHEFYNQYLKDQNRANTFLDLIGVDISSNAVDLARENQALQLGAVGSHDARQSLQSQSLKSMTFTHANVLQKGPYAKNCQHPSVLQAVEHHSRSPGKPVTDILISNPPYISTSSYWRTTSPSVRNFEPKLALVPPTPRTGRIQHDGDLFYHHILILAQQLDTRIILVEVADLEQAKRVASLAMQQRIWDGVEIWRDDPKDMSLVQRPLEELKHESADSTVPILGSGNGRSVLAYRGSGAEWLDKI